MSDTGEFDKVPRFDFSEERVLEELGYWRKEMANHPEATDLYFQQLADVGLWEVELNEPKPEDN